MPCTPSSICYASLHKALHLFPSLAVSAYKQFHALHPRAPGPDHWFTPASSCSGPGAISGICLYDGLLGPWTARSRTRLSHQGQARGTKMYVCPLLPPGLCPMLPPSWILSSPATWILARGLKMKSLRIHLSSSKSLCVTQSKRLRPSEIKLDELFLRHTLKLFR